MRVIYDIWTSECQAFAEGVDRIFRKMSASTMPKVMTELEANMARLKASAELDVSERVKCANEQGALLVKYLQSMEMV